MINSSNNENQNLDDETQPPLGMPYKPDQTRLRITRRRKGGNIEVKGTVESMVGLGGWSRRRWFREDRLDDAAMRGKTIGPERLHHPLRGGSSPPPSSPATGQRGT